MKNVLKVVLSVFVFVILTQPVAAEVLKFTAIPDQDTARLEARFGKIADYLSRELGVQVEYVPVKSYAASVAAFKNNEVQLAWFGGLSGVKARRAVAGAQAIAQGDEDRRFKTFIIANNSTGLKSKTEFPKEIQDKTFTFGSKGSTSGRLMPEFYIRKNLDAAPNDIFKRVGFSGDHSKTISLVQAGSYEIGAVNFKVWEKELAEGKIDTQKVQVIWETPEYPDYNWSIRPDVEKKYGAGFIEKVQEALISMSDKELLDSFPRSRFIAADNTMYQPILDTATEIGIIRK